MTEAMCVIRAGGREAHRLAAGQLDGPARCDPGHPLRAAPGRGPEPPGHPFAKSVAP
jgi:hypothetical protein